MILELALAAVLHRTPRCDEDCNSSRIDNVELVLNHEHCEFGSLPVFHVGCQDHPHGLGTVYTPLPSFRFPDGP